MEGDRFERQNRFTGLVHRWHVLLESADATVPNLPCIDKEWNSGAVVPALRSDVINVADIGLLVTS